MPPALLRPQKTVASPDVVAANSASIVTALVAVGSVATFATSTSWPDAKRTAVFVSGEPTSPATPRVGLPW